MTTSFWLRHWRCVLWGIALAIWTVALTTRQAAELSSDVIPEADLHFVVGKSIHVSIYAALTATAGLLGARGWTRFLFPVGMVLHGMLTEFVQWYFPSLHRHGCWSDVGLDTGGVILGLAAGWLLGWWRFTD